MLGNFIEILQFFLQILAFDSSKLTILKSLAISQKTAHSILFLNNSLGHGLLR